MDEGHSRDVWSRLSMLCALIGNCHRDPRKGRAFKPGDFDPHEKQMGEVIEITSDNIDVLREAFFAQQGRKGI